MILLVDVGNTRAKWAVLADGRLSGSGAVLHRGVPAADWVHGLDGASAGCERILVSNVAGPAVAHAIGEWALSRHGFRPEFVRATREAGGIRNAYEHPEALGPDRWCGMIGAWRRVRGPLVCIAAGTAMTIDAVDAAGTHLGGLIVPGHDLMIDSLLRRTSDIAPAAQLAPPASMASSSRSGKSSGASRRGLMSGGGTRPAGEFGVSDAMSSGLLGWQGPTKHSTVIQRGVLRKVAPAGGGIQP